MFYEERKQEEQRAKEAEAELKRIEEERANQASKPLTKEERLERKRMKQFAEKYDGEMVLDSNGDFVYVGDDGDVVDVSVVNSNVERVKQDQLEKRESQKKKHMQKLKKDKEDLERDKQRKDKAKKKTVKKEKRRGNC